MTETSLYDEAKQSAMLFAFFAHVLNEQPDSGFVAKLHDSYVDNNTAEVREFWQMYIHKDDTSIAQDLAVEWNGLFRGVSRQNGVKPPYAGIFMAHDGLGTHIMSSLNYMYESYGFVPTKTDRPDYLGTILDFAAYLLESFAMACERADNDKAESYLKAVRELDSDYISPWVAHFIEKALAQAKNPFYRDYLNALSEAVYNIGIDK